MFGTWVGSLLLATATIAGVHDGSERAQARPRANADPTPSIAINDNRQPAGTLAGGVLTLDLRANYGAWQPDGERGPVLRIQAFGEGTSPLSIPAPLVRVPEGTEIAARIRNDLSDAMRVNGLCEQGGRIIRRRQTKMNIGQLVWDARSAVVPGLSHL